MTALCPQDEDSEAVLAADFEIGHFIRERIVPRAVLYFTGEAIEDDDDDVSDQNAGTVYSGTAGAWSFKNTNCRINRNISDVLHSCC